MLPDGAENPRCPAAESVPLETLHTPRQPHAASPAALRHRLRPCVSPPLGSPESPCACPACGGTARTTPRHRPACIDKRLCFPLHPLQNQRQNQIQIQIQTRV